MNHSKSQPSRWRIADVLVAVQDRPSCDVGALVRVKGRFDGPNKRVDAATVTCD